MGVAALCSDWNGLVTKGLASHGEDGMASDMYVMALAVGASLSMEVGLMGEPR